MELVRRVERSFGGELSPGGDLNGVGSFCAKVKERYGVDLPSEYQEFLLRVDGFEFNGYHLLGTSEERGDYLSMIEVNETFHENENLKRYWFYGTSDMDWYVFDKVTVRYLVIDVAENVWHDFSAVAGLIHHVLSESMSA